jgi:C1A family cysteine protease
MCLVTGGLLLAAAFCSAEEALQPQMAPLPEYEEREFPPGTGFIPQRIDQSHITGQEMPEKFKELGPPPAQFDWRTTGKITSVKDQDTCGACYAFATLANFEARILIDGGSTFDFSENHAKECNYYDRNCRGGNYWHLANLFSKTGTVLESCDSYVPWNTTCNTTCPYQKTLLDWRRICGQSVPSTTVLKNYIQTYGPVYTSMYAGDALDVSWWMEMGNYDGSYTLSYSGTYDPNHAVCIIGWDDTARSKDGKAGAWIVKNSWGSSWGGTCGTGTERGYFYISYGDARIGEWSSFLYDWQDYDTNGGILYYDEGGWRQDWGYGSPYLTAWGMCKFVPASACYATRVEFWTTDITTDVDVYLYDTFSGGTLSGLLASYTDTSFGEVGYHSVAFSSPPSISAGNDVYAAVAFTNSTHYLPVAACDTGTVEANKTYISWDGNAWTEAGLGYGTDVAIRLRHTTSLGAPGIDVIPDTLKYGQVTVSTDSVQAMKIKNTGTDTLRVTDINPSSSVLAVSDTAFKVAPSGSTNVSVTFTPAAVQSYSEHLTIVHNAKGTTVVPVLGQGIPATVPGIAVSPDSLDFGQVPVGSDSSRTLHVRSTGTDTLRVADINSSAGVFGLSDTAFVLAPADSHDVTVTFTPAAIQTYAESLVIVHNAAKGATTVPVTGQGVALMDLTISAGDIHFIPSAPLIGDTVDIMARVHYDVPPKGIPLTADSVLVRFYDGNPDSGGVQIGADQIIPSITADSSETAGVQWTAAGMGIHPIHVLVDPEDDFVESNETNNRAHKPLAVATNPIVLSVDMSDPSPTAAGPVDFIVTFDRTMNTAVQPAVSYGLARPYDARAIGAQPGWSVDSTQWTGRDTIEASKGDGWNTIRIATAQDPVGHTMDVDTSWTFFIDTAPPSSQAASPQYSSSQHFPVTWSGTDPAPGSGVATYTVTVAVDGLFPSAWLINTTDTAAVYTGSNGHFYSFSVAATDSANNQETPSGTPDCTTWVDTQTPDTPVLLSPPDDFISGDPTPALCWEQVVKGAQAPGRSGHPSGGEKLTPVTYHLQLSLNAGCLDPVVDTTGLTDTTFAILTPLADDQYFWRVQAVDMAGNESGFQTIANAFFVDTQPPLFTGTTQWPDTSYGGPFPVTTDIGDPSGINQVLLWYRAGEDTLWQADTMEVAKGLYGGFIPEQMTPNTELHYYVSAEDGAVPPNTQTEPLGAPENAFSFTAWVTGLADDQRFGGLPERFALYQNYPDPFNAGTEIRYALPRSCFVTLEIYNIVGQQVALLVDGPQPAGTHTVRWDGIDDFGQQVASGVYLYRLRAEKFHSTRKMVLLR